MKSSFIVLMVSIFLVLMLTSCQQDPEVLEGQAAQALEELSDEELQQLEKGISENKPLTGQVYQVGSIAAATRGLNRLPAGSRATIIRGEVSRRGSQKPCTSNSNCSAPQICGTNNAGEDVCELPNQPVDSRCHRSDECAKGLVCQMDNIRSLRICLPFNTLLNQLGEECGVGADCVTGLCGINNSGERVCEEPNQPVDSRCYGSDECASGICGRSDAGDGVCEEPNQPVDSRCYRSDECASGICGRSDAGDKVCEEPNQPEGSICDSDRECASGICGYNDAIREVCELPNQPEGSICGSDRECASGICRINNDGAYRTCV